MFTRIPLPLLPLCIKAVKKARSLNQAGRSALYHLGGALADLEDDLRALVEPRTVEDLTPYCFECQAPGSLHCAKCQVLAKGRVN